jgi:murein DD-endopeptidase MepM/ murein hydrolase activator NlpD
VYHHGVDYLRDDAASFLVEAAAPGHVVFSGWDPWSGNTIIVSQDVASRHDAFRTIYMHLRNGASHDCQMGWNTSVPSTSGTNLSDYEQHLVSTGCTRDPSTRRLDPANWGNESDRVMVRVGQTVSAGTPLAHSGDTGPGGKRGAGGPNTHLHVFFAHRDPTNGQWYFFDPYGIYADPSCYPTAVTGKPNPLCAKYPVAWIGGAPRYSR